MLIIVPTPIGNLGDLTFRALETLKQADAIICEDTRRTQILLKHYQVENKLISYHEHSDVSQTELILVKLREGQRLALVSDGGTPLLSDPGFKLVRRVREAGMPVETLPGASSITTALVASGLATDTFTFFGFLPPKSAARKKNLEELEEREETLIFFESPYRLIKTLNDMQTVLGDREAVVARELTKKFEEMIRGKLSEILSRLKKKEAKGEMVLLVAGKNRKSLFAEKE